MSVLIKGMEMPNSCYDCRLFVDSWCYAFGIDDWRNAYNKPPKGERLDNCPLIEVPAPHGDLIDRNVLADSLSRLCKRVCQYSEKQRQYMCSACPLGDAFPVVEDDAPTVIEEEEGDGNV